MIGWFKRVLGRSSEYDEDELAWSERRSGASDSAARQASGDSTELRDLRGTVDALRGIGPVKAPRSFALTEENLAAAGYDEQEIRRVLRPGMRRVPIWQRPVLRQLPLAVTALALLVGGYFVLDDIDVMGPPGAAIDPSGRVQVTVEAQVAPVPTAQAMAAMFQETVQAEVPAGVTAAAEVYSPTETRFEPPRAAPTADIGVTVEVQREVQRQTVEIEIAAETVLDVTVAVERAVETEVTRVVEREVLVPTPATVVTRQAEIEVLPTEDAASGVTDAPLSTPTPAVSEFVATAQPAPTAATASAAGDEPVVLTAPTATTAALALPETAVLRPPEEVTGPSETRTPSSGVMGQARIWPSAVALALALAGLVVWFELRRRRKLWE